eukprot:tig00000361_g24384.t1
MSGSSAQERGGARFLYPEPAETPETIRGPYAEDLAAGRPSIRESVDIVREAAARRQRRLDEIREKYDGKRAARAQEEQRQKEQILVRVIQSRDGVPPDLREPERRGSLLADMPRFAGTVPEPHAESLDDFSIPRGRRVSSPPPPSFVPVTAPGTAGRRSSAASIAVAARRASAATLAGAGAAAVAGLARRASTASLGTGAARRRASTSSLNASASAPLLAFPLEAQDLSVTPRTRAEVDHLIDQKLRMLKAEDYSLQQAVLANAKILSGPAAFPSPAYAAELRQIEAVARAIEMGLPPPLPSQRAPPPHREHALHAHIASTQSQQPPSPESGAQGPSPSFQEQRRRRVSLAVSIDVAVLEPEHDTPAASEPPESRRSTLSPGASPYAAFSPSLGSPGSPAHGPPSARRRSSVSPGGRRASASGGRRSSSLVGRRQSLMGSVADLAAVAANAYVNDEDVELDLGRAKDRPNSGFIRMISRRSAGSNAYNLAPQCWTPSRNSTESVNTLRNQTRDAASSDDFALARKMAVAAAESVARSPGGRSSRAASLGAPPGPWPSPAGGRSVSSASLRRPATAAAPPYSAPVSSDGFWERPSTAPAPAPASPGKDPSPREESPSPEPPPMDPRCRTAELAPQRRASTGMAGPGGELGETPRTAARHARLARADEIIGAADRSLVAVPVLLSGGAGGSPMARGGAGAGAPGHLHFLERAPPLTKAGIDIVTKSQKRLKAPDHATLVAPPNKALLTSAAHGGSLDMDSLML